MKKPLSTASAANRVFEDQLYARIYEEIESGQMDRAAQARAIEEGGGDNGAIRKAYIKHRMESIKADLIAEEQASQERAKAEAQAKKERIKAEAARKREIEDQKIREKQLEEKGGWFAVVDVVAVIALICFMIAFLAVGLSN